MRLQNLIDKCAEALQAAASSDYTPEGESDSVVAAVYTDCGTIDMYYKQGEVEVTIYHDTDNGRWSKNLEGYFAEQLRDCINWDEIHDDYVDAWADEFQQHGFASESDFWHWKEG